MDYEVYRIIKDRESYFKEWGESAERLTPGLMGRIYEKYVLKAKVLQRDGFRCQNSDPEAGHSEELTIHHFKHKRNKGKDTVRNMITVCKRCHERFNKTKAPLIFSDEENVPSHMRGITQMLHIGEKKINWKHLKAEMKILRKNLKYEGITFKELDWRILVKLMEWLAMPYDEYEDA